VKLSTHVTMELDNVESIRY